MDCTYRYVSMPSTCDYLPEQIWRFDYVQVARMTAEEYASAMRRGWRRFGRTLYRPRCPSCSACRSLRIDVATFAPDRSQRRAWKANRGEIDLRIGTPAVTLDGLDLFARFHENRSQTQGWPDRDDDPFSYHESFIDNPFPTEEWRFTYRGTLVGLGYVDALPIGLSGIYFVHDPGHAQRSLGTWNVLSLIDQARERGLSHVYLGYHVPGYRSLAYKARFRPHEFLGPDGHWHADVDGEIE